MPAVAGDLLGNGSIYWTCCIWRCLLAKCSVSFLWALFFSTPLFSTALKALPPEILCPLTATQSSFIQSVVICVWCLEVIFADIFVVQKYISSCLQLKLGLFTILCTLAVVCLMDTLKPPEAWICWRSVHTSVLETCLSRRCQEWRAGDGHFSFVGESRSVEVSLPHSRGQVSCSGLVCLAPCRGRPFGRGCSSLPGAWLHVDLCFKKEIVCDSWSEEYFLCNVKFIVLDANRWYFVTTSVSVWPRCVCHMPSISLQRLLLLTCGCSICDIENNPWQPLNQMHCRRSLISPSV